MKTILAFLTIALVAVPNAADARIGQTKEECIALWGAPTSTRAPRLKKSEGEADVFTPKKNWTVTVEYRAGKAWFIVYQGSGLSKSNAETLLGRIAEGGKWKDTEFLGTDHWTEKELGLHAVFCRDPYTRLMIFSTAALDSDWNPRRSPLDDADEEPAGDATAEPEKEPDNGGASDPLDGL